MEKLSRLPLLVWGTLWAILQYGGFGTISVFWALGFAAVGVTGAATRWYPWARLVLGCALVLVWFAGPRPGPWLGTGAPATFEGEVHTIARPTRSGAFISKVDVTHVYDSSGSRFNARLAGTLVAPLPLAPGQVVRFSVERTQIAGPWFPDDLVFVSAASRLPRRDALRARLVERLAGFPPDVRELLVALTLGTRSDPGHVVYHFFRHAGIIHVLALSGLHIGFVGSAVRSLHRRCWGEKGSFVASLTVMLAYLWLVGPLPGLVRALAMALIGEFVRRRGFRAHGAEVLAASFMVHSMFLPGQVAELGFLLSYSAVAGISLGGELVSRVSSYIGLGPRPRLAASLGAQLGVLPILSLAGFGFQPEGILVGLVATPLAAWLLAGTAAYLLISPIVVLAQPCALLLTFAVRALLQVAKVAGRVPPLWFTPLAALAGGASLILLLGAINWRFGRHHEL